MDYLQLIIQILVTLSTLIPLVIELVKYVQKAVKEKNWQTMIAMAMRLMTEAEDKFETGADRKEWVMGMIKASAETINYDIDEQQLSELIDNLVELTKSVNTIQIVQK